MQRALSEITSSRVLPELSELLDCLAGLARAEGKLEQAALLLGASNGLLAPMEMIRSPVFRSACERCREQTLVSLGDGVFEAAYSAGAQNARSVFPDGIFPFSTF